jgi:tight adherence protein C
MLTFVLIIGLFLLAIGVTMVARAAGTPGARSTEPLEQIDAYGFAGTLPRPAGEGEHVSVRERMGSLSGAIGRYLASRFSRFKMPDYRARLVSAGMYNVSPERLLGLQLLTAIGAAFAWFALGLFGGVATWLLLFGTVAVIVFGWLAPAIYVDRVARKRREQIEKDLPDLIDLIVVTLEAGLSFPQSLRLAATKIKEPLAAEVRLTLQEQNMGLTLVEALENFLSRIDTPGVRMFARSIAQGETMGVSTGQIMRNLAIELRKRRRAYAEERAQKAPVKMLFPIAFLIMPSLFMILLVPMALIIGDVL